MKFSRNSYYEHFQWDSVFKPSYQLKSVNNYDGQHIATISVSSRRFKFLKNNPLVSRQRFYFESGKIRKIENMEFIDVDWEIWEQRKSALVSWIDHNYPELNGFINELTLKGAMKYLQAIRVVRKPYGLNLYFKTSINQLFTKG